MRLLRACTCLCAFIAGLLPSVSHAGGALDDSFSGDGWVRTLEVIAGSGQNYLPEEARGVAIQPDGKIVVTGEIQDSNSAWYFGVFRYLPNGELDPTFSNDGWTVTKIGTFDFPYEVALGPNGTIIVVGETSCRITQCYAIVRYTSSGTLDTSFGGDGVVHTKIGRYCGCALYDVAVRKSGKITAVGYTRKHGDALDDVLFGIIRLHSDGRLDKSFSGNGKRSIDFGFGDDLAESVTLLPRGKILVAGRGTKNLYRTQDDFAAARLRRDGSLDGSFSGDGKATIDLGSHRGDGAYDSARQNDGRIVLAGATTAGRSAKTKFGVVRLNGNGSVDRGFGVKRLNPTGYGAVAEAVVIHPDRSVIVGGRGFTSASTDPSDWLIARYRAGGSLMTAWGGDGIVRTNFGTGADSVQALGVTGGGKIVATGTIYASQGLARYLN